MRSKREPWRPSEPNTWLVWSQMNRYERALFRVFFAIDALKKRRRRYRDGW